MNVQPRNSFPQAGLSPHRNHKNFALSAKFALAFNKVQVDLSFPFILAQAADAVVALLVLVLPVFFLQTLQSLY